ncbi:hypothetical protein RN001_002957 [Aquatica leii]|uniref:Alpha-(1,6)-fucosyltransferase n=1 Tax=Aquatica leii TaxID=1421715 RepID=A0AAN7PQI4_9COLE|nr:hypothetical protein RN001_002957 [Aquatica leii]
MGFEYKRSIVNSMEKLKQVDGFNEWRTNEIANLSNIVQERLRYLQNPVDCKIRKKLMCTINYQCGFGCQMHHLVSCMVLAYGLQRTLILKSKGWQYHKEGWEDIFMPLSNNCTNVDNVPTDTWPGYNDSEVIHVPSQVSILPRPIFLPLAVPEDLLYRLNKIHGNPIVWWIGQILKYVWKPQKKTETYIKNKIEQLGIKSPFVGVHIRRTDKIGSEAAYHSIEEYMIKVNEYFDITRRKTNDTKRRVYIATDDFAVITEAKSKYPNYEIFYNQNLPKIPNSNFRHTNDKILDVILDIHILSHSSFLVCTFSSNICRLAYEFMQNDYVDASSKFSSLDDVYYYSQQEYNKRKVILNHKAESPHEIDLLQGDIIHIAGNHWDGYSLGTNLRTNEKGLYPSFKVEIESESVKFPTYSEINGFDGADQNAYRKLLTKYAYALSRANRLLPTTEKEKSQKSKLLIVIVNFKSDLENKVKSHERASLNKNQGVLDLSLLKSGSNSSDSDSLPDDDVLSPPKFESTRIQKTFKSIPVSKLNINFFCILCILRNQQSVKDSDELLAKAQKDLFDLKKRYNHLENSRINQDNKKCYNVPKFEYESLRRKLADDVEEFWYFVNSKFVELESNSTANTSATINNIYSIAFEYKRALTNNIEKLKEVDGFNNWRHNENAELSNIVQKRLHYLQNPVDCKHAKKLVCSISYSCGFGCQIHHLISCMILAYGMRRTLILESTNWQYNKNGWQEIFMPLSNYCTNIDSAVTDMWPGNASSEIIRVPTEILILPRSDFLPQAVPEDLVYRLRVIHGNPIVWWIGQMLKYIWKPQKITKTYINKKIKKIGIKSPFVGVHVRRTDKVGWEASYHYVEEYMNRVEEYYNIIELKTNITKRRVYIATDDLTVITETKSKYPDYEILYNHREQKINKFDFLHSNDNILDVIFDIHMLSHCNFLVCTFSSNICRLAYELMQNDYIDASTKIASLDDVYYYSQQNYNKRKVVLYHKAQTPNEIDLLPGDIIHIAGNHWNGYSLGTNLRTNEEVYLQLCGFGCQIHHLISCMILVYGTQRTLVLESHGWQYHKSGWNDIFMPLSKHCTTIDNVSIEEWPGTSASKAIRIPTTISPRSQYMPWVIPQDLINRLKIIHGNPIVWWIGQILKYIWKLQNSTTTYVNYKIKFLNIKLPYVGVHVRRTDKLIKEASFHAIEEYMTKVDEYYNLIHDNTSFTKRRVYIATDDFNVITETKAKYSDYEILYNPNIPKSPRIDPLHRNDNLLDVILDLQILSRSNFLVCTLSSNICRLTYELMQNNYIDASTRFASLDFVYYYSRQKYNLRKVILSHKAQIPEEIDLLPGDIINIDGSYQQDKQNILQLLRKAQKEISELKRRQIILEKIKDTNNQLVGNITNYIVPTFEYEVLRRRVMRDIQELWYFIDANLNELNKLNMNLSTVPTIKENYSMEFEYKRILINNINKLTKVDGFNEWRINEIFDLSNIVQTRLHYLQNPLNCESAKKLVCTISYPCGFGCQMHHLVSCMVLAYGMQRTLILESSGWQYHRGGWNQIFMPLSNNCTTASNGSDQWPGTNNSRIIRIPSATYIIPRSHYLPLAVPEDLFVRLKVVHGNPTVWWIGQI